MMATTLLDGGTGTELRARGIEVPSHITSIWSAQALYAAPDAVVAVHRDYMEAGADVITANNYAVTPPLLAREGIDDRFEELTRTAVALARQARDETGRDVRIAASMPPLETSYRANLVGGDDTILATYRGMAALLAPEVDILLCETMSSAREGAASARAACEASSDGGPEVWISWTLQGDRIGRLPSGETLAEAFAAVADLPIAAYLVNCCGANFVTEAIPELKALTDRAVGGYANAADVIPGGPSDAPSELEAVKRTPLGLQGYTDSVRRWIERGAAIVGGCCSTRPSHTAQLRELIDGWGRAER